MPFTLTRDHVHSIFDPLSLHADSAPFLGALDPEVRWVSGSEKKDSTRLTGVYVRHSYFLIPTHLNNAPLEPRELAGRGCETLHLAPERRKAPEDNCVFHRRASILLTTRSLSERSRDLDFREQGHR
jgi:hypothetical protein